MSKPTIKEIIEKTIIKKIGTNKSFTLENLLKLLPNIKESTIRVNMKRLIDEEYIIRTKNGVYFMPNKNRVLKEAVTDVNEIVRKLYIEDSSNDIVGYYSGINFARGLGLTTQTASKETIYSNLVSDKKREIEIQNIKFIINSPRFKVNKDNYKVLQIMDLIDNFEKVSEVSRENSISYIKRYLEDVSIEKDELLEIIRSYPLKTQVKYYEAGVGNVITQK